MRILKSLWMILNFKTIIITLLSITSTWICIRYELTAEFPLTLVGIAIVFPIVFSINSAYTRRERALSYLADFHAHTIALYMAARDWVY